MVGSRAGHGLRRGQALGLAREDVLRESLKLASHGGAKGVRAGDSNPIDNLQKQTLSCAECSIVVLRHVPVSCGYASLCYAT